MKITTNFMNGRGLVHAAPKYKCISWLDAWNNGVNLRPPTFEDLDNGWWIENYTKNADVYMYEILKRRGLLQQKNVTKFFYRHDGLESSRQKNEAMWQSNIGVMLVVFCRDENKIVIVDSVKVNNDDNNKNNDDDDDDKDIEDEHDNDTDFCDGEESFHTNNIVATNCTFQRAALSSFHGLFTIIN